MSGTTKEDKGILSVNLDSSYVPTVPSFKNEKENLPKTIMYWVVGEDGKDKKYLDASPEEIISWVNKILPADTSDTMKMLLQSFNKKNLLLANNKAYYLGIAIKVITEKSRINCMFGKPQQWDQIEEWARLKKAELADSRKNTSDKK